MIDGVVLEDCRLIFRNFKGEKTQYNNAGNRNFCTILPDDIAEKLDKDGWNVKYLKPREEDEEPTPYLQVAVSYDNYPPKIMLVTSRQKTLLDEKTIDMLDWAEIKHVDLQISPYEWEVNGKTGVKAYCKVMYVTVVEDPFEDKYYDES